MTSTTLQTELEAVNVMLTAAGEAPVASLVATGIYPLTQAKQILTETSRVVQSRGWHFNTLYEYPLVRNGSGNIVLPDNTLEVRVEDAKHTPHTPVLRGVRLFDSKARTYVFPRDFVGTVVELLAWDDLPQAARHYITIRAARTMQGRNTVPDSVYRYTMEDEADALQALSDLETTGGNFNMLSDSLSVSNILRNSPDRLY